MVDDVSAPEPPLAAIPADIRTLADYARHAPRHLPAATWAHLEEGAAATLADNRAAFDRLRLLPRAFADLAGGHTTVDLPGGRHATPLMIAPIAYRRLAHPDGDLSVVRAATALDIGTVASTLASETLEAVAVAATDTARQLERARAPLWFQLYLQSRREDSLALVRRAEDAGYHAIVLTIDAGVKPSAFTLPPGVEAANLAGMPRPRHVAAPGGRILFGTPLVDAMPGWGDLAWLREVTRLPLLVKGLVTGGDVPRLADAGVDGLILSNHGGRVLDALPSPLAVLEDVCAQAAGRLPVLVDGGVRSGTDVVKALCLGAGAVLVGRPILHALAVAGVAGVAHALQILRVELEFAMVQMGCRTVAELTRDRVLAVR